MVSLTAARHDPAAFIAGDARALVIDEVQRAPDLLLEIKASVDSDRRPGRFVLTGSADVLSLPRVAETLAGRMEVLRLWPLSQGEIEGRREGFLDALLAAAPERLAAMSSPPSNEGLVERIVAGGFPEALERDGARRGRWFDSYLDTMLQREVRDLANVAGLTELPRLMALLASRATGLLNYAGLSRDLGMPQTTLKRYLALLETAFLVAGVPAWFRNVGKRLVKSPKLILTDAGILAHLLGGHDGAERAFGPVLENFVLMELLKQASFSEARPGVFHYRTSDGLEVDALIEPRGGPPRPGQPDSRGDRRADLLLPGHFGRTTNPLAGAHTSFEMSVSREDGSQRLNGLQFVGKRACLLAAHRQLLARLLEEIDRAREGKLEEEEGRRASIRAMLALLAADPPSARLLTVEILAAGTEGAKRHEAMVEVLARRLHPRFEPGDEHSSLPAVTWVRTAGVLALIGDRVMAGEASGLPELEDELVATLSSQS